ncbi:cilia- and flagella-associated protein 144-like [Babylonia areolata]|uniref:cilia- and flagella-associated protein 144-like n=1 Tax=Babylonia areolata TaxID=304850 RepID=UPI003FD67CC3
MAAGKEKEPKNMVHQNAILCETVTKENRHQKLYTNYSINPFKEFYVIAGKPNQAVEDGEEDNHFLQVIKRANQEPVRKYDRPQTEAQEVGWITKPLIQSDRGDTRLNFFRQNSPITKFMDKAWLEKEQQTMGN